MNPDEARAILQTVINQCDKTDSYVKLKIRHVERCIRLANDSINMFLTQHHDTLLSCIILHDIGRFIEKDDHCRAGHKYLFKLGVPKVYQDVALHHGQIDNQDFSIYNLFTRDIDCLENLMRLYETDAFNGGGRISKEVGKQSKVGLVDAKVCQTDNEWRTYYNAWIDHNITFEPIQRLAKKYRLAII